jgi:hypothetical protein
MAAAQYADYGEAGYGASGYEEASDSGITPRGPGRFDISGTNEEIEEPLDPRYRVEASHKFQPGEACHFPVHDRRIVPNILAGFQSLVARADGPARGHVNDFGHGQDQEQAWRVLLYWLQAVYRRCQRPGALPVCVSSASLRCTTCTATDRTALFSLTAVRDA